MQQDRLTGHFPQNLSELLTRPCKTCQVKNFLFLEIFILQRAEKTDIIEDQTAKEGFTREFLQRNGTPNTNISPPKPKSNSPIEDNRKTTFVTSLSNQE